MKFSVIIILILQCSKKFCEIKNNIYIKKVYIKSLQITKDEGNMTFCVGVQHVNLGFELTCNLFSV